MIKLNTQSETIGGAFGVPHARAAQLVDLLEAAGNAYLNNLLNSNEPRICLDKIKIVELFTSYAENEIEIALCLFYAGQVAARIEDNFNNAYIKSFFQ